MFAGVRTTFSFFFLRRFLRDSDDKEERVTVDLSSLAICNSHILAFSWGGHSNRCQAWAFFLFFSQCAVDVVVCVDIFLSTLRTRVFHLATVIR